VALVLIPVLKPYPVTLMVTVYGPNFNVDVFVLLPLVEAVIVLVEVVAPAAMVTLPVS
jgi:hypothetical protein